MNTFRDLDDYNEQIVTSEYIVLFFTATWCGPCKVMYPLIEKLSESMNTCKFYKIDVDETDTEDIVDLYGVQSMPTFFFIKNGDVQEKLKGANKEKFTELITLFMKDQIEDKSEQEPESEQDTPPVNTVEPVGFFDDKFNFSLVDDF